MTEKDNADQGMTEYEVTVAREIGGAFREVGEPILMTEGQAKYYLPPYGTGLKPAAAKSAPKPKAKPSADEKAEKPEG